MSFLEVPDGVAGLDLQVDVSDVSSVTRAFGEIEGTFLKQGNVSESLNSDCRFLYWDEEGDACTLCVDTMPDCFYVHQAICSPGYIPIHWKSNDGSCPMIYVRFNASDTSNTGVASASSLANDSAQYSSSHEAPTTSMAQISAPASASIYPELPIPQPPAVSVVPIVAQEECYLPCLDRPCERLSLELKRPGSAGADSGSADSISVCSTQSIEDAVDWVEVAEGADSVKERDGVDDFLIGVQGKTGGLFVMCNTCSVYPITGNLYRCTSCSDFDLCQQCYHANDDNHDESHVFERYSVLRQTLPLRSRRAPNAQVASQTVPDQKCPDPILPSHVPEAARSSAPSPLATPGPCIHLQSDAPADHLSAAPVSEASAPAPSAPPAAAVPEASAPAPPVPPAATVPEASAPAPSAQPAATVPEASAPAPSAPPAATVPEASAPMQSCSDTSSNREPVAESVSERVKRIGREVIKAWKPMIDDDLVDDLLEANNYNVPLIIQLLENQ